MHAGYIIVPLLFLLPLALYALLVGLLTRRAASWPVALLRPPLLMLALALGFEAWLTTRRRRAQFGLRSNAGDPDSARALRDLSGGNGAG